MVGKQKWLVVQLVSSILSPLASRPLPSTLSHLACYSIKHSSLEHTLLYTLPSPTPPPAPSKQPLHPPRRISSPLPSTLSPPRPNTVSHAVPLPQGSLLTSRTLSTAPHPCIASTPHRPNSPRLNLAQHRHAERDNSRLVLPGLLRPARKVRAGPRRSPRRALRRPLVPSGPRARIRLPRPRPLPDLPRHLHPRRRA